MSSSVTVTLASLTMPLLATPLATAARAGSESLPPLLLLQAAIDRLAAIISAVPEFRSMRLLFIRAPFSQRGVPAHPCLIVHVQGKTPVTSSRELITEYWFSSARIRKSI